MKKTLCRVALSAASAIAILSSSALAQPASEPGRFIVVLNEDAGPAANVAREVANNNGGRVGHVYTRALRGFSVTLPEAAMARVAADPRVAYVERDLPMSIAAQTVPTGIVRSFAASNAALDIDGTDDFRVDVDIAILDTGIDVEHPDLNVVGGIDCTYTSGRGRFATQYCEPSANGDDDHYHGTHVAGSAAALDNGFGVVGVAPGARLWAVKVLDSSGSGSTSGIIAGIDWVVAQGDIEVLNMSLGGSGVSTAYLTAIDNAVANGVVVVVAAGNSNADANNFSPAYVPSAITVSALADFDGVAGGFGSPTCRADQDDTLADFSNWGTAVDIAAPGVCILSTYPIEQGSYASISGTSMASPYVAGAAGLLASGANSPANAADVQAIRNTLVNTGNLNWTDDSGDGVKERLLDVSTFSAALIATGDGNTPPTAAFSASCSDLSCSFADGSSDSDGTIVSWAWNFDDGATSTSQNPSHSFAAAGDYTVSLTVTDNDGATATRSSIVSVTSGGVNSPPSAAFTDSCTDLSCAFTDTSSDSDGTVVSWSWNFGDGASSTLRNPSHAYGAAGTYTVSLVVSDDAGASDTASTQVTVSDPVSGGVTASVNAYKVRGFHTFDYSWSGAGSASVDIYLNGSVTATTANDGSYTVSTSNKGGGAYTHRVCEAGSTTACSLEVTSAF